MGVRDALRMIDSFIKWARRNEERAKSLDDFIHDGLVAAAKRCESCLKDDLGLTFAEDEAPSKDSQEIKRVPPGYEISSSTEEESDEMFEVTPDDMSPEPSDVPIESEDEPMSIDAVDRLEEDAIEDISLEGPLREFSTDFELVEPTDLMVESPHVTEKEDTTPEEIMDEANAEDVEQKPSFTWSDYEKAVTPTKEDSELIEDEDVELPPPMEIELPGTSTDSTSIPEPPDLPIDEMESGPVSEEDGDATEDLEPLMEPPAPPPPPESDEDEEERRRRARRLFFGD
jgi:hypothetical protein